MDTSGSMDGEKVNEKESFVTSYSFQENQAIYCAPLSTCFYTPAFKEISSPTRVKYKF